MSVVGDTIADAEAAVRELAVYLSYDRDAARGRGDDEAAGYLHGRHLAAIDVATQLRALNPSTVAAGPSALAEVRAIVAQLSWRLAGLVPEIAAERRAVTLTPAPAVRLANVDHAVAYLRVSTDRQAEHGFGLDVQEATVVEWARKNRVRLIAVVRDEGRSGAEHFASRPALAEALGHVEGGRANAIIVPRLDRIARDQVLQEWIRAEVITRGGQLRSADPTEDRLLIEDPDNPTSTLVRQILGAVAQHEREMIRLRMAAGKAAKRQAGGYAHGQPPYGYRAVDRALVADVDEQRQVSRMRRWRREGASLRDIADRLNAENVPARRGRWHAQTVARALDRATRRGAKSA